MKLMSLAVRGFKRVKNVDIDLKPVNVLVGSNNSGKSSVLQGVHWAVSSLLAARGSRTTANALSTLSNEQFLYRPSSNIVDVGNELGMRQDSGPSFSFRYKLESSETDSTFELEFRRGKNANISLRYDKNDSFFAASSNIASPYTIFVPGLAGISVREEERSPAVLNAGIAQGDSNLYLRNIINRILDDAVRSREFHDRLHEVFPNLVVKRDYNKEIDPYISISASLSGSTIPIELLGTGCLQVIQLVAYSVMYQPKVLLLDEPDAHLHPLKQKMLARMLVDLASKSNMVIILATHSRHILDEIVHGEDAQIVWMKDGSVVNEFDGSKLPVLLDLAALDKYEIIRTSESPVTIVTEDQDYSSLRKVLSYNDLSAERAVFVPTKGIDNIGAVLAIADFFASLSNTNRVIVHIDRDMLSDAEVEWLKLEGIGKLMPERCHLFVTDYSDIESYFCTTENIASSLEIDADKALDIISTVINDNLVQLTAEAVRRRESHRFKLMKKNEKYSASAGMVGAGLLFENVKGKTLLKLIHAELSRRGITRSITNGDKLSLNSQGVRRIVQEITGP